MRKRRRRSFTPEFKQEAVRLCEMGDRSIAQVAKDLDLTETALREWVKRAEIDAGKGPAGALTTEEREELTRLRRENKRLQMEREILNHCRARPRRPPARRETLGARSVLSRE
ncbi:MAG: transposase [Deltaproteobacteria bacterium]|nr:transposase [Deltaproteobacteria bacterium]